MKTLKLSIAAFILAFSFQAAKAQVSIGVSIGAPQRVVVVREPVYHPVVYERPVVYARPAYRRVVVAPAPRRVYTRRYYHRPPVVVHRVHYDHGHRGRH
jgi:sRNA-binding carbon storage regulator CsrA